jgi:hypothetical protein
MTTDPQNLVKGQHMITRLKARILELVMLETLEKGEGLPEGLRGREGWRSILLGGTG